MSKKISITGYDARETAFKDFEYCAKAVMSTIGPFGLNFLLEKGRKITNDGYTISSEIISTPKNEFGRLFAQVAHEASAKTNDMVGDFTSGAWALNYSILKEIRDKRYLGTETTIKAKKTPAELRKMINKSKDFVISEMEKSIKKVESKEELIKSAMVSVEDEKIAELLGTTQWELGPEGRIIAEEVNANECTIEKVDGILLDNGFVSSSWITNPEKQSLEIKSPLPIILTNYTVGVAELKLLRESIFKTLVTQQKSGCILMARAFTSDAIKEVTEGKNEFAIILVNAPYENQKETMKDIEAIVGGRYIDTEEASLAEMYITDVGCAKRLVAQAFNSQISGVEDEAYKERVAKRIEILEKKLIGSQSDFDKRKLGERIAQLKGGFCILKVGSSSVSNRKRIFDKCEDAVNAVRYALKGGTVKGGGLAFKEISDKMEEGDILKRPILSIYNQIMESAPEDFVIEDWVRDPFLVLKCGLENACEFASGAITVNGIITTEDEKKCTHND